MKSASLSFIFIVAFILSGFSQNLIGIEKSEAAEIVKKELKGFNLDNTSKNESFNYLKFLNSAGTKTLVIFFSDENKSTHTRMVCDYSELDFLVDNNNKNFKKTGKSSWEYSVNDQKYTVNLEEKEWYFVVTTKKK